MTSAPLTLLDMKYLADSEAVKNIKEGSVGNSEWKCARLVGNCCCKLK